MFDEISSYYLTPYLPLSTLVERGTKGGEVIFSISDLAKWLRYSSKRILPPLKESPFCLNPDHLELFPKDGSIFARSKVKVAD
jgi:hypothetical protein